MKFIDFFAGIGGFREGLEHNGHTCVGWCEYDKFKQRAYRAVHNTEGEWFKDDITTVQSEELPEADLYVGGFPCQSFSIAGKQGGFKDTRGTLFFEFMQLAKERKPKYLLLENVKGLLSHNGGSTFGTILNTLWECGYNAEWQVLNSKDFGVPQSRERIFIVGYLRGQPRPKIFPIRRRHSNSLRQIIGGSQGNRVYDIKGTSCTLAGKAGGKGAKTGLYNVRVCLTPNRIKKRQNGRRFKEPGEPSFTLTKQDIHGVAYENKIRRLTPLECFRLQGFPDKWHDKCKKDGISDTQMYRAAGDSVTVNVIEEIGRRLN